MLKRLGISGLTGLLRVGLCGIKRLVGQKKSPTVGVPVGLGYRRMLAGCGGQIVSWFDGPLVLSLSFVRN